MAEADPYSAGYTGFKDGKSLLDNPYPRGKPSRDEWRAGWWRAQHDAKSTKS